MEGGAGVVESREVTDSPEIDWLSLYARRALEVLGGTTGVSEPSGTTCSSESTAATGSAGRVGDSMPAKTDESGWIGPTLLLVVSMLKVDAGEDPCRWLI